MVFFRRLFWYVFQKFQYFIRILRQLFGINKIQLQNREGFFKFMLTNNKRRVDDFPSKFIRADNKN